MLGPVRFTHIEACTRRVCGLLRNREAVEELVLQLTQFDDIITSMRAELAAFNAGTGPTSSPKSKQPDYSSLLAPPDLAKAQRLIKARRGTIDSLKNSIERKEMGETKR
jgi:hypothetical protein